MAIASTLQPGNAAPDVTLFDVNGMEIDLASTWAQRPVLLFFLRHFGCSSCREHLFHIRGAYADITRRGATAVAVSQNDPGLTARFASMYRLPFPMLADPQRLAYWAFGVVEGSVWENVRPSAMLHQTRLALHGNLMSPPTSLASAKQLGGTFIVDTSGTIRLAHIAQPIYNYPLVQTYLDILEQLPGPTRDLP